MTILRSWGLVIPALACRKAPAAALCVLLPVAVWVGPRALSQTRPAPSAATGLKAALEAIEKGDAATALRLISAARAKPNPIPDYLAFWEAQAHLLNRDHARAASSATTALQSGIDSPVAGRAALLAAESLLELKQPRQVLPVLLQVQQERLQQPGSFAAMARAQELNRDLVSAADFWQRVYLGYPLSKEASEAETAMERLRADLGDRFPVPPPSALLGRAMKFTEARQHLAARREYLRAAALLRGLEKEQAQVRASAALYQANRAADAASELAGLAPGFEEADAERLYWLVLAYRRLDRRDSMQDTLDRLRRAAPLSPWRQKALVMAANEYFVSNEPSEFLPLYRACADEFPDAADASVCHWRVTWRAYLDHRAEAPQLLREHLKRYPSSEKAAAALYYLGRDAERSGDNAGARRFWREAMNHFPNSYYGVLSRGLAVNGDSGASPETDRFLNSIPWPARERAPDFSPDANAQKRIQRARFLVAEGLETWAESEMRYGARNGANPWPLALELARTATRRGAPPVAVRHIKGTVPGYLFLPRDAAPIEFWKYAFPFPYRAAIERHARERGLDPFLVAALIRQESEFDPNAVSVANAIGLMQVMPRTGRELSRKVGLKGFHTSMLRNPAVSINLGTYYLSRQLETRKGSIEDTLAGYNAGPTRIPKWRGWADYREPAEFVETIPLQQTRDYVQIIERNADIYRWLYANEPVRQEPDPVVATPAPKAPPKAAAPKSAPAKSAPAKTKPNAPARKPAPPKTKK